MTGEVVALDAARSARGRSANQRGKSYERDFAKFLQVNGWPEAQRAVATGWKNRKGVSVDPGDIKGTPSVSWDVKGHSGPLTGTQVAVMLSAVEVIRLGADADYGFLIERRTRQPVANWLAHTSAGQLTSLITGDRRWMDLTAVHCSIRVRDLVSLLHIAGYGERHNPFAGDE